MPIKWEQAKAGNLGMYFVAADEPDVGKGWVLPAKKKPDETREQRLSRLRNSKLPPRAARGQDGSHNFLPCLLAGAGEWEALDKVLAEYWARGGGNEFNSPLYSVRVFTAACLSALLGGSKDARLYVKRWVALLSLQAIVIKNQAPKERFQWADDDAAIMRHLTKSGVVIPPTGMRVNHSLGETLVGPVLAHVLGIEHQFHSKWANWRDWTPPRTKTEAEKPGSGPLPNQAFIGIVELAEKRRKPLRDDPWMRFCRDVVLGDMDKWQELADRLSGECTIPLGRGVRDFTIDRRPDAVGTFLTGTLSTVQKPSIPAAVIEPRRTRVLMPAKWGVPATVTKARLEGDTVIADADQTGQRLARLKGRERSVTFRQVRWW